MTERSKTVVMLIDWDNLQICHSRDAPGTDLDLHALIALAQSYGTLVSARAYAEWNLLSERLAVYKAGIEPVFAPVMRPEGSPREGKSLADTVMVADGVDLLWTVTPDVFVLVTSDKDMIPLARIAKQRGAAVVVLGSDLTAIPLVEMSNVFITYRQLLRELDRVTELEAPSGRAPARERRLRESRRPSSEPYGGPPAIGTGSTSRGVARTVPPAVALRAPQTTYDAAPARRVSEPITSVESDRPVASATGTSLVAPISAPPGPPADRSELSPLGPSDATPRRRRRRGGRGRRTGLDGVGEDETQTVDSGVDSIDPVDSEGDEVEVETVSSRDRVEARPEIRPDDLDTAVLELLAARDRQPGAPTVEPEPPVVEAESEPVQAPAAPPSPVTPASTAASTAPATPVSTARTPVSRSGTRRRAATTSFSDFGPSAGAARTRPAPTPEPESVASPATGETPVLGMSETDRTNVEETSPALDGTPVASGADPVAASLTSDEANAAASVPTPEIVVTPAENGTAPSEPALEGAAGSVVDTPNSEATETPTSDEPAAEAKRARPVRRRTRRTPTKAANAAAESAASESGS